MAKRTCPNGHIVKDSKAMHCPECGEMLPETKRKKRLPILAIVLGVLFLCVIGTLLIDNDDSSSGTTTPESTRVVELTSTPYPTATQNPTATLIPISNPTLDLSSCKLDASFLTDVTIMDGTVVTPGEKVTKIWQVENTGTCPWSDMIVLTEVGADTLGQMQEVPLFDVEPGDAVSVAVELVAPDDEGTYHSEWHFFCQGEEFGTALFAEIVVVEPTPTPSASDILQSYVDMINASGMGNYIDTVGYHEENPLWLDITVKNTWHYEPEQIRLQAAQALWEVWAGNFCPHDDCVDCCRITLYDLMGNDLGGSSLLAGSVIKLED